MIPAVRNSIRSLFPNPHALANPNNPSLLFNRLCRGIDEQGETENKNNTIDALANGYPTEGFQLYTTAFKRWKETMAQDKDALCFEMEVRSPLVVGKGDQNVHEFGITLQAPWGTPVIPGAAIKGVLSSFAHEKGDNLWQKKPLSSFKGKYALIMFGGTNQNGEASAGCLDFMDAWWIPTGSKPFGRDITTVHNRDYRRGKDVFPDGTCDPLPNSFIVIQPGQKFLFTIRGTASWCKLAKEMLKSAAKEHGFGAKTRLGYGRMIYLPTVNELRQDIPEMSDSELATIFTTHGSNSALDDIFRDAAKRRSYDKNLEPLFKKYRPALVMLQRLRDTPPQRLRDIRNVYQEIRERFKDNPIDTADPDVQDIYGFCQKFPDELARMPPDAWVWRFTPSAEDLLKGKNADEAQKIIANYTWASPPLGDFRDVIEKQFAADEDSKEILLWELEYKLSPSQP
ncbi:MAG: type III-B CRISPR module RAMP protein Cmr6 [Deltaproteobacteria bacterium]|nr:MAG: type III-B CRISPR module RAMP protein Cmr6 [Deltaproteobacteria bacterium]